MVKEIKPTFWRNQYQKDSDLSTEIKDKKESQKVYGLDCWRPEVSVIWQVLAGKAYFATNLT